MPTDTQSGLAAIRTSAAIFPLTSRAFLRISGADATRWLNGMVTNNIAALAPGEGNYNFLLNAQGRIQGDCTLYRESDGYRLETDTSQIETIRQHFEKFIIMDDVELPLEQERIETILILGSQACRALTSLGISIPAANRLALTDSPEGKFQIATTDAKDRFELLLAPEQVGPLVEVLGLPAISAETIEAFRIVSGIPKFGVDITEKYLPQETAQTHALHFSKGCYLGQEIVERIHSRGQVHRIFTQFTLTGEMPQLPTPLESNGKPAGELTSAALIDGTLYALGYARREFLETHQALTYANGTATPSVAPKLTT